MLTASPSTEVLLKFTDAALAVTDPPEMLDPTTSRELPDVILITRSDRVLELTLTLAFPFPSTSSFFSLLAGVTAVRLQVEQNQLVDVSGETGVFSDALKGA